MKPTSIIFLLISLIIVLTGWLICRSAEARAASDGVEIFSSTVDDDEGIKHTETFGSEEVYNKIEITVDEADIYIFGGYPTSSMDIINFEEGSYRMTTSNRNITIDTTIDLMSIIRFWDSGFSFHGLRDYVRRGGMKSEASKRINLLLPSDSDVNIIKIKLGRGNVYVNNFDTTIDVELELKEGNASFSEFRTTSQISANIDKGSLYMQDVKVGVLDTVLADGDITADRFEFDSVNIVGGETSVSLGTVPDIGAFNMNLSARHGNISLYGENKGGECSSEVGGTSRALITVSSGDIVFHTSEALPGSGGYDDYNDDNDDDIIGNDGSDENENNDNITGGEE